MLAVRTLRPLSPEGRLIQPALEGLRVPGLHVVCAPPAWIISEHIAAILEASGTPHLRWIRLSRLDLRADCLAATLGLDELSTPVPPGMGEMGSAFGSQLPSGTDVVIENNARRHSINAALRVADGLAKATQTHRVVVVSHSSAAPRLMPPTSHRWGRGDLALDDEGASVMLSRALPLVGVEALARLVKLASGRAALLWDTLDAVLVRDPETLRQALLRCRRAAALPKIICRAMLRTCTAGELEALCVATQFGYWSPQLGPKLDGRVLRPWLVALENDWFWLRPLWMGVLARELDSMPQHSTKAQRRTVAIKAEGEAPPEPASASAEKPVADAPSASPTSPPSDESALRRFLSVRLLGRLQVAIDGTYIEEWEGRIPSLILSYLLMQPNRSAARDVLMETFWPNAEPDRARNRLHVALSALRRSIRTATPIEVIEHHNHVYRIAQHIEVSTDVDEFSGAFREGKRHCEAGNPNLALESFERAFDAYGGDLLVEMPYEEWAILPREAMRMQYIDLLNHLAPLLEGRGRTEECIRIGHRMLAEDPCSEAAHQLLMRAYGRQGRIGQAGRQYEICRRILERELGVAPSAETTQTLEATKRSARTDRPPRATEHT